MNTTTSFPAPRPEYQPLAVFVGHWQVEGKSYGEGQDAQHPYRSAVQWKSQESYEWLAGGFFLLQHWDAQVGDKSFSGLGIMGFDEEQGGYFANTFDNGGHHPTYQLRVVEDTWTFTGEAQRAQVIVGDGGHKMTFHWEWTTDGVSWLPLCDRTAIRIDQ